MYLAQYNIGKIRYPLDDPRMAEFVANVDRVNKMADRMPGFIWRLQDETGHAMHLGDDPMILPNLTVWENAASLKKFVFETIHSRFYDRREEWFLPIEGHKNVLWHISSVHDLEFPDLRSGEFRLKFLNEHGPTSFAFTFKEMDDYNVT